MFQWMGKTLVIFGIVLAAIGALIYLGGRIGLGRLPGDIVYRRGGFTFYFPILSSIILSIILTILLNMVRSRR